MKWHTTQPMCIACYQQDFPRKDRNARPAPDEECCRCGKQLDQAVTVMVANADGQYPTITEDGERVPVAGRTRNG